MIKSEIRVDLGKFPDRFGNFLVLAPEIRIRAVFYGHPDHASRLFIEFDLRDIDVSDLYLILESRQEPEVLSSYYGPISKSKMFIDNFDRSGEICLEVYSLRENRLVFRKTGRLINQIHVNMSMGVGTRNVVTKTVQGEDKTETLNLISKEMHPALEKILTPQQSIDSRVIEKRKLALIEKGALVHFPAGSRQKALDTIRRLLRDQISGQVCIWDPYFGEEDLQTYLPFVVDVNMNIRIITDLTGDRKAVEGTFEDFAKRCQKAIQDLRNAGVRNIQMRCRFENNGQPFHDRFILTTNRCWMLGSSLNSIGKSHSLMVEIEYPEIIQAEFDALWQDLHKFSIT